MMTRGNIALMVDPAHLRRQTAIYRARRGLSGLAGPSVQQAISSGSAAGGAYAGAVYGSAAGPIGTVIGAAVGLVAAEAAKLLKTKESDSSKVWHTWGQTSLNIPGRQLTNVQFAEPFLGFWQTNQCLFPANIKAYGEHGHDSFLRDMTNIILTNIQTGAITQNDSASSIFAKVIRPWIGYPGSCKYANPNPILAILTAAIDRYIAGVPIARADMPEYKTQGYTLSIPTLGTKIHDPNFWAQSHVPAWPGLLPPVTPTASTPALTSANTLTTAVWNYNMYPDAQWLAWAKAADPDGSKLMNGAVQPGYLWGPNQIQIQVVGIPSNFWQMFMAQTAPYITAQPTPLPTQNAAPIPQSAPPTQNAPPATVYDQGITSVPTVSYATSNPYTYPADVGPAATVPPTSYAPPSFIPGVPNSLLLLGAGGALIYFMTR